MKFAPKHLVAAALLAALGAAAVAQSAPGAGPGPGYMTAHAGYGRGDPAQMQERMARMQERMTARLNAFKQKLQLSPGQEAAWNTYVAALKPTPMNRPDRGEMAKLSTPERIDRMRSQRATRLAEMDKRGDATKVFYAALTPEQKKVFDEQTLRGGGRHGHGGPGGHRGMHRG